MIYLDAAATTKPKTKVKAEVNKYLNSYANPMSAYGFASEPKEAVENARNIISEILKCEPEEIYFTSGGSEANSWALKGLAFQHFSEHKAPLHIYTTLIEHHSILHACEELKQIGLAEVTYLGVDDQGFVLYDALNDIESGSLVSIGWANNEIGTIQDMRKISAIVHEKGALLHSDAVQAYCKIPIEVSLVDLMSVSAHKWGAPKGVGFLFIRNGIKIMPLISGGEQENGLRGGTHNVPYIAGMAVATQLADINQKCNYQHEQQIKFLIWKDLVKELPKLKVNGTQIQSLPNILNLDLSAYGVQGVQLAEFLSVNEICISTGSACNTTSNEPSHVLKAIGLTDEQANSSIRMSFNENNTLPDVPKIVECIVKGVKLLGSEV